MAKLTIELNPPAEQALERLAHDLGTTKADVIRRAMSVFDKVNHETKNGRKLAIADENNRVLMELVIR